MNSIFLRYSFPHIWFATYTPCTYSADGVLSKQCAVRETLQSCFFKHIEHRRNSSASQMQASASSTPPDEHPSGDMALDLTSRRDASKMAMKMVANHTNWVYRFVVWSLTKVFKWLFGGEVYVDSKGLVALRELQQTHTVVYVTNYKSSMDPFLLSYVLFSSGLMVPHIIADAVKTPVVGWWLRHSGAFSIQGKSSRPRDTQLFKMVLGGYIETLLTHGQSLAFPIEGRQSPDGVMSKPMLGILSCVVDGFFDRDLPKNGNVALVPVSTSYDLVPEEDDLIQESLRCTKASQSLWKLCKALIRMLLRQLLPFQGRKNQWGHGGTCGRACVAFGQPISLVDFSQAHSRCRSARVLKSTCILTEVGDPLVTEGSKSLDIGRNDAHDSLLAAFPKGSSWRRNVVAALACAVHSQLRKYYVVPSSGLVVSAAFLQSLRCTPHESCRSGWIPLSDLVLVTAWLEHAFTKHGGRCRSVTLPGDSEVSRKRIAQISHQMKSLFKCAVVEGHDFGDRSTVPCLRIISSPSSYIQIYSRLVQVLGVLAPQAIVGCATIAIAKGFSGKPYQSDVTVATSSGEMGSAARESVLEAAVWIRVLLAGELDGMLGESSFLSAASFGPILDAMCSSGELQQYEVQSNRQEGPYATTSSVFSEGQQESIGDIVDMLIGEVVDDVGRTSMSGVSQSDATARRRRTGERDSKSVRVRRSVTIMEWEGGDAPDVSWTTLFQPPMRSSVDSESSLAASTEGQSTIYGYAVEPESPAEMYAYLLSPILATYRQALVDVRDFLESSEGESYFSIDSEIVPHVHKGLRDAWENSNGVEGTKILLPIFPLVRRVIDSMKRSHLGSGEKAELPPFPMLVRVTSSQQGGVAPPRTSSSSVDLSSVPDLTDEFMRSSLVESPISQLKRRSFEQIHTTDRLCLCKELRDATSFQGMIKRLSMFIPD